MYKHIIKRLFYSLLFVVCTELQAKDEMRITFQPSVSEIFFLKDSTITDPPNTAKKLKKEKVLAAVFAFPLPFGFIGAHRVILGTKPWVPIVYAATLGGGLGLLPLIDFCIITFGKNSEKYKNNGKVFMWIK